MTNTDRIEKILDKVTKAKDIAEYIGRELETWVSDIDDELSNIEEIADGYDEVQEQPEGTRLIKEEYIDLLLNDINEYNRRHTVTYNKLTDAKAELPDNMQEYINLLLMEKEYDTRVSVIYRTMLTLNIRTVYTNGKWIRSE